MARPRRNRRGDGGRVRTRALCRGAARAAGGARSASSRVRRRDHGRRRPRPARAALDSRVGSCGDASRIRDRGSRGRERRELRADRAGRDRRARERDDRRAREPALDDAGRGEPVVLEERAGATHAPRAGRRVEARLGRRDHARRVRRRQTGGRSVIAATLPHGALLVFEVTILVLAIFLGIEVISKVPTLLHTPLMSGTNAIHGIVIVGAMLVLGLPDKGVFTWIVGFVAVVLASANVVGGFVVTDRMLEMFKKREPPKRP